ncbi:nonribosomal peptide [Colletotrichum plurivorum]|uniref:Nonribosomal peptide n=1 Tax=Colletotrichum plurivorum TaxID=2175906 RepID=A0A8H6N8M4_9PEZI|nr:nonribosomal peptide [Colletotrichum plurivorum]
MAQEQQNDSGRDVVQSLKALCASVLSVSVENIDENSSFVALGGDSFKAVHLFQKCTELGLGVRFQDLLHRPLREVATSSRSAARGDDAGASKRDVAAGDETYPQMPFGYNLSKIFDELAARHRLGPDDVEDVYPCSPMQESMYIGQKMSSKRLYRTRGLFEAQSGLDPERFRRSWDQVVLRHDTLRTVYVETSDPGSGRLLDAVVLRKKPARVVVRHCDDVEKVKQQFRDGAVDVGASDEEDQHQITIYTDTKAARGGRALFQMDLNHLTVDGSSLMIVINELIKGIKDEPVPGTATSYGRYIDYLQNQVDEDGALDYWIDYLDGAEPCYFPALNDNRKGSGGSFEVVEVPLTTSLADLRAFGRSHNVTISNALQAVWALVLYTYTGDPDVCFGYMSSGRSLPIPGVADIVGPMMNLLVCRVGGIEGKSLAGMLAEIRDDFVGSLPHQCFSIGKVQRILGTTESRLFNTIMTSYYSPDMSNENNLFKLVASHNASDFDIVLKVKYSESDVDIRLAYSDATLSPSMAENVAHTFSAILERLVKTSDPESPAQDVTGISPQGLEKVMEWNTTTPAPELPPTCVHQLIEERARLQPDAPAIFAWDGEMTYKELDEAATSVASHIIDTGIGPGAFIPLCFEKSKWYPVALLAVMKSGNAFVPLDPLNPAARKQEMLKQVGVSGDWGVVICSRRHVREFTGVAGYVLELNREQLSTIRFEQPTHPPPRVTPQDPAYIIFTSGSMGVPKGVVIEHGAYAYAARAHAEGIKIGTGSRVLQFASYGFDTSMEDHLTTFAVGACLCVPSEDDRLSLPDLAAFTTKARANWAHLTPSFAEMLTPTLMPTMRTMVLGGEAMSGKNVRTWANAGRTKLVQVYGPSECCVTSTIGPELGSDGDPTQIGSAVPGCATWVVRPEDPNMLQAVGAVGELLMEGPILAHGYLNSAQQTTEAFVTALAWAPEKRLYRTGDLVKYDSAGRLHFVGRRDGQVKLRGQRMELGEIERQLVLEPKVQHCVVVVPSSGPCAKRLVALITFSETVSSWAPTAISTPSTSIETVNSAWTHHISRMRDFLLDRIPPFMNPELWIVLRAIPRNSSGKLDRKRLTKYLEVMSQDEYSKLVSLMEDDSSERPGTVMEQQLREIWSEVLNVSLDEIRWNSSFYYLGGDSISAMTVSSMARQQRISISAAEVLRCRTIERLAKLASEATQEVSKTLVNGDLKLDEPFELSPIQQLHFQASSEGDVLDQQTMVVQITKKVGQDTLLSGLQSLVEAHPMLRARFERVDGVWKQRVPGSDTMQRCRVRFHNRDNIDYVVECISEAKRSLGLTDGSLIAVDVFETGRRTLLSITIHHLVVDTVSWRTLFRELENFLLFGTRAEPEMTTYQSWCLAQSQYASSLGIRDVLPSSDEIPRTDVAFWNMEGKANCFEHSVTRTVVLDPEFTRSLSSTREMVNYTALDIMTTAITESFHETFGRSPAVFIEGHGRESFSHHANPSDTVGWFTTFCPVFAKHQQGKTITTLRSVRDFRAKTPLNGLSYFASRFLNKAGVEAFKDSHWPMEVTLNYLGSFQQFERDGSLFRRCDDALQAKLSELRRQQRANTKRYALISILAVTKDDQLSIEVEWNSQMSHQDKLNDWVSQLEQSLNQIIVRLSTQDPPLTPFTPFLRLPPSVGLNPKRLSSVLSSAKSRLGLQPSDIAAVYPCSPIQDSLMLSQLKRPTDVYSQHFLFKLSGTPPLNPAKLAAAWNQVVDAHPILRTTFLEHTDGSFLQIVLDSDVPEAEVLTLEDEEQIPELWAKQFASTGPSPLSGKPLHKLRIYAAKSGSVYCCLDKNHIITDGATSRLLVRNFLDAYEGRAREDLCPYANYIKYTSEQDMDEITRYWNHYLDGAVSCQFPKLCQAPFSPSKKVEFSRTSSTISDKTSLESACRTLDVTLPVIFQAAWAVVLSTYLNSDDVTFGLLCHGRDVPIPGAQEIIGPMASIVPIRARLPSKTHVSGVIDKLREDSIAHLARQAISLARILHAVKRSGDSIFNTILNFQKTGAASLWTNTKAELLYAHDTSEYDIAVCITDDGSRLEVTIESPTHFMSEAQSQRLLSVYINAVHSMVRDPDAAIGDLSLATDLDRDQLHEWNARNWETSKRCIHEMISETTLRQPSRPAISSWDGEVTYAQLDLLSTKLAAQLQSIGAKPEEVIVLCFEKSLWAVVAMLAVAKSGASFVHIDPKGAPKRTEFVIKQTKSRIGLASLEQYDNFVSLVETILIINKPSVMGLSTPNINEVPSSSAEPANTLYTIFTSGTTGTPKGVVIPHESFCSAVVANRAALQIKATSRVLQFTNFCFDASLEEIFTVLVAGGCICMPSEKERLSDVPGFVARKKVNWAAFTPSFLRTLDPADLKSVKFITVHAEPMGQDLVARWADKIHMRPSYGPTECSVTSTVGSRFEVDTDATNIGFPIGCRGWVVHPDNHDVLMPVGAVGELLLDGPIIGRGYLNDEAKTEAAFIDPPAWAAQSESDSGSSGRRRMYKTGDLVRFAEDGSLLIQRRKDHSQVKIRGQRVELGEIQHHLDNLSGTIQHSMVFVPGAGLLKGRLVAVASLTALSGGLDTGNYGVQALKTLDTQTLGVEGRRKVGRTLDEISSTLEKDLPQYMIPETWLIVQSVPVQLSLKLDRQRVTSWVEELDKATLQSTLELSQHNGSHREFGSDTEEAIRKVWGDVLGIEADRIALDQSFFRLGGDSIYAMQVMKLCRAMDFQVSTQDVLANPTVRQLASVAAPVAPTESSMPTPPHSPDDTVHLSPFAKHLSETSKNVEIMVPCSPFQERMYRSFLKRPQKPYLFNSLVALEGLDNVSPIDVNKLLHAWQQTVDRHAILRTVFVLDPEADRVLQKVLKNCRADIAVSSVQSESSAIAQSKYHLNATRSRLFKDDSPPLSVRLFFTSDERCYVHFIMGHILIDHVSLTHVFADFTSFYRGQEPAAPQTTFDKYIQYLSRTRDIESSNKFWVNALKGVKPWQILSDAGTTSTSDPHAMGSISFSLEVTDSTRSFLRGAGVTLSNLLQFSWAATLHVYTGHATVCFGHLISDRDVDLPHANDIVGPMLSVAIARAALDDGTVLLDALRGFQEEIIRGLPHKTYDLAEVERRLGCEETGVFSTLVNYRKVKYAGENADVNFRSIWKQDPHEQYLVLAFNEEPSRLEASLTYYESLFSRKTLETLADTYQRILGLMIGGQHRTAGEMKAVLNA